MSWQEEYKRIIAEREAEQRKLEADISHLKEQIGKQQGLAAAIFGIGSAYFGRTA